MPEYLVGISATAILTLFGILHKKSEAIDHRIDRLEVKVAETYVTKEDLRLEFERIGKALTRMEDKIDAHVSEDTQRITSMKRKYNLF